MKPTWDKPIPFWEIRTNGAEHRALGDVLASGWWNEGHRAAEVEKELAGFLGVAASRVVATTSGTMALYLALVALGIAPGDEVLVPDVTFPATANAVEMAGGNVVLTDVGDDLMMDPVYAETVVTGSTAAIVPVHVSGRPAPVHTLASLGIPVVEDACEALGSGDAGVLGNAGVFSFTANKLVTSGQGGAAVFALPRVADTARRFKNQGRARSTALSETHESWGMNGKWTDIQAALLLAQMIDLPERVEHRRLIRGWYQAALAGVEGVELFPTPLTARPLWVDVRFSIPDAPRIFAALAERGIEARLFWRPLHEHPHYAADPAMFPNASRLANRHLWLPSHLGMTESDVGIVVDALKAVMHFRGE